MHPKKKDPHNLQGRILFIGRYVRYDPWLFPYSVLKFYFRFNALVLYQLLGVGARIRNPTSKGNLLKQFSSHHGLFIKAFTVPRYFPVHFVDPRTKLRQWSAEVPFHLGKSQFHKTLSVLNKAFFLYCFNLNDLKSRVLFIKVPPQKSSSTSMTSQTLHVIASRTNLLVPGIKISKVLA